MVLPVKDLDEQIVMCLKYSRNKSEGTLKETLLADCKQIISFFTLFKQGNDAILVSPDCYYMAGQVCSGFAGLRMLPGAREIKI